jgi:hypothetical protein
VTEQTLLDVQSVGQVLLGHNVCSMRSMGRLTHFKNVIDVKLSEHSALPFARYRTYKHRPNTDLCVGTMLTDSCNHATWASLVVLVSSAS